eukprot:jgi/Psemu1/67868/estExt_Genemark1.C_3820043
MFPVNVINRHNKNSQTEIRPAFGRRVPLHTEAGPHRDSEKPKPPMCFFCCKRAKQSCPTSAEGYSTMDFGWLCNLCDSMDSSRNGRIQHCGGRRVQFDRVVQVATFREDCDLVSLSSEALKSSTNTHIKAQDLEIFLNAPKRIRQDQMDIGRAMEEVKRPARDDRYIQLHSHDLPSCMELQMQPSPQFSRFDIPSLSSSLSSSSSSHDRWAAEENISQLGNDPRINHALFDSPPLLPLRRDVRMPVLDLGAHVEAIKNARI